MIISDSSEKCLDKLADKIANLSESSVTKVKNNILDENALVSLIDSNDFNGVVNCSYPKTEDYGKSFLELSFDSFNKHISDHLGSNFLLLRSLARKFEIQKDPISIVLIGSIYGSILPKFKIYEGTKIVSPIEYTVIKTGLINLARYVTKFVSNSSFRVNLLSPGGIYDDQDPKFVKKYLAETLGSGMLHPDDINPSIEFLLSSESSNINGQNIIIDDGFTL